MCEDDVRLEEVSESSRELRASQLSSKVVEAAAQQPPHPLSNLKGSAGWLRRATACRRGVTPGLRCVFLAIARGPWKKVQRMLLLQRQRHVDAYLRERREREREGEDRERGQRERDRERQREDRERETERQRDRERQRETERERQRDRETERPKDTEMVGVLIWARPRISLWSRQPPSPSRGPRPRQAAADLGAQRWSRSPPPKARSDRLMADGPCLRGLV